MLSDILGLLRPAQAERSLSNSKMCELPVIFCKADTAAKHVKRSTAIKLGRPVGDNSWSINKAFDKIVVAAFDNSLTSLNDPVHSRSV